jgi:nucleoside-diphosphate-sugar epimerase
MSGYLGGYIVTELLKDGYRVRGTIRDDRSSGATVGRLCALADVSPDSLSAARADLDSDDGWEGASAGCRFVIHTASPFPARMPKHAEELIRPAREGTLRVLRAAHRSGVERVIVTSSVGAVNHGTGKAPYAEGDWTDTSGRRATAYYQSKTLAEQAAWSFSRETGMPLTVLNPGVILGPLLTPRVGASVGLIAHLLSGRFRGLPRFGFSIADVRDVAAAHVRAMITPCAANERFIVSGKFLWMREVCNQLARDFPALADRLPVRETPDWAVRAMALVAPQARSIVHELGRDLSVDTSKARDVLDWNPRPESDTLRDTARSLLDMAIVRQPS